MRAGKILLSVLVPVVLVLAGLALVGSGAGLYAITGGNVTGGSTILSIDSIRVASNVNGLAGPSYLITLTAGGSDKVVGKITPQTIQQYGIKQIPSGPFEIDLQIQNISCQYPLQNDNLTIYKIWQYTAQQDSLLKGCPFTMSTLQRAKASIESGTHCWIDAQQRRHCGEYVDAAGDKMLVDSPPNDEFADAYAPGLTITNRLVQDRKTVANNLVFLNHWCYWTPGDQYTYVYYTHRPWGLRYITTSDPDIGKQQATNCCPWAGKQPGLDPGDWRVTSAFGYPYYLGYKISSQPKIYYKIKVTLRSPSGASVSTYITPENKVATLGDIGRVKLVGGLLGETMCGQPGQDYAVVKEIWKNGVSSPGRYKLVPKSFYNTYKTGLAELINLDIDRFTIHINKVRYDPGIGGGPVWTYLSKLNTDLREIHDNAKQSVGSYQVTPDGLVISSGSGTPFIPLLQLIIKADWLGVQVASGQPKITSIEPPSKPVVEGTVAFIRTKVKNIGQYADQFEMFADCGGIKQVSVYDNFEPGDEKEEDVPVSVGRAQIANCTVYAKSTSNPSAVDSKQVTVQVQQPIIIGNLINMQRLVYEQFSNELDSYDVTITLLHKDLIALRNNVSGYEYKILIANNSQQVAQYGIGLDNLYKFAQTIYSKLTDLDQKISSFQSEQEKSVMDLRNEYEKEMADLAQKAQSGEISQADYENEKYILQYQIDQLDHMIKTEISQRRAQVQDMEEKISELKDTIMKDKLLVNQAQENLSKTKKKIVQKATKQKPGRTYLGLGLIGLGVVSYVFMNRRRL